MVAWSPAPGGPRLKVEAPAVKSPDLKGLGPTCVAMDIDCNSTVSGQLQTTDCELEDGTFIDVWFFDGTAGQEVTVDLESTDFDTFLFLFDPELFAVAFDNNGGDGTNSRIVFTLDTSGEWSVGANNLAPLAGDPGDYTLTLSCSGDDPDPEPPAAPSNLTATTVSSTAIDIDWQDNADNEADFEIQFRPAGGMFSTLDTVPADTMAATVFNLDSATTYTFRIRARNADGNSDWSNQASATTDPEDGGGGDPEECVADDLTMCLNDGRFKIEMAWRVANGDIGTGRVVDFTANDSGLFYFFDSENWEVLVKVLDGCALNDHFWVFAAATTDVEYTLQVTDTMTGEVQEYFNPLGQASPAITDTSAFETCP